MPVEPGEGAGTGSATMAGGAVGRTGAAGRAGAVGRTGVAAMGRSSFPVRLRAAETVHDCQDSNINTIVSAKGGSGFPEDKSCAYHGTSKLWH